jgi:hypothetical protein
MRTPVSDFQNSRQVPGRCCPVLEKGQHSAVQWIAMLCALPHVPVSGPSGISHTQLMHLAPTRGVVQCSGRARPQAGIALKVGGPAVFFVFVGA